MCCRPGVGAVVGYVGGEHDAVGGDCGGGVVGSFVGGGGTVDGKLR